MKSWPTAVPILFLLIVLAVTILIGIFIPKGKEGLVFDESVAQTDAEKEPSLIEPPREVILVAPQDWRVKSIFNDGVEGPTGSTLFFTYSYPPYDDEALQILITNVHGTPDELTVGLNFRPNLRQGVRELRFSVRTDLGSPRIFSSTDVNCWESLGDTEVRISFAGSSDKWVSVMFTSLSNSLWESWPSHFTSDTEPGGWTNITFFLPSRWRWEEVVIPLPSDFGNIDYVGLTIKSDRVPEDCLRYFEISPILAVLE